MMTVDAFKKLVAKQELVRHQYNAITLLLVNGANSNGNPQNNGMPREDMFGHGEFSAESIKRKTRNRMMDDGINIFVQSEDRQLDDYLSLSDRYKGMTSGEKKTKREAQKEACSLWFDECIFGGVHAYKETKKGAGDAVSLGIKGAMTIKPIKTVSPIIVTSTQITKSANSEIGDKKGSDTMGTRYRVEFGLYVMQFQISTLLAQKNGVTEGDIERLKYYIMTMFYNDESAARPAGTMSVERMYWFTHPGKMGNTNKVYNSVQITQKDGVDLPMSIDDYNIVYTPVKGVDCEIIESDYYDDVLFAE